MTNEEYKTIKHKIKENKVLTNVECNIVVEALKFQKGFQSDLDNMENMMYESEYKLTVQKNKVQNCIDRIEELILPNEWQYVLDGALEIIKEEMGWSE